MCLLFLAIHFLVSARTRLFYVLLGARHTASGILFLLTQKALKQRPGACNVAVVLFLLRCRK